MNMDRDHWHEWVERALKELGDAYKYEKFRALMREYDRTNRMKKFLKVGEYDNKGGK
jgi:hypothetical protein